MNTTYYPIRHTYVGPNDVPLEERDYIAIQTSPGLTNLSHEPLVDGWLGTTVDWCAYALGAYHTLKAARLRVAEEYGIELRRLLSYSVEVDDYNLDDEIERYSHVDTTLDT